MKFSLCSSSEKIKHIMNDFATQMRNIRAFYLPFLFVVAVVCLCRASMSRSRQSTFRQMCKQQPIVFSFVLFELHLMQSTNKKKKEDNEGTKVDGHKFYVSSFSFLFSFIAHFDEFMNIRQTACSTRAISHACRMGRILNSSTNNKHRRHSRLAFG